MEQDPLSPEYAPVFTLITLMRLYDVTMALLTDANPEAAAKLYALHNDGKLLGGLPWLNMGDSDEN